MKQLLALLLALATLVSFVGCGETVPASTDETPVTTTTEESETTTTGESETTTTEEPETEPTRAESKGGYVRGTVEGNTFTSEFLGLSCTVPEGWTFYSEEQMQEIGGEVVDYADEDDQETMENAKLIYEMFVIDESTGCNINMNLQKLNVLQMMAVDTEQVLKSQLDSTTSLLENMGVTDLQMELGTMEMDGKAFDAVEVSGKIQGIEYYAAVVVFLKENYIATVTFTSMFTDRTEEFLGWFDLL